MLPAEYGDCVWIECFEGGDVTRVLIDGGTSRSYPSLRSKLLSLPPAHRRVDVLVVTHIDADHIGGALRLLSDDALGVTYGDVWFNGYRHLPAPMRGVKAGVALSSSLGQELTDTHRSSALPWNEAFDGGPVATAATGTWQTVEIGGGVRLTLLSPTPAKLAALGQLWERELDRARRGEPSPQEVSDPTRSPLVAPKDVIALADERSRLDRKAPNGSSIAFLLEYRGGTALLAADAQIDALGAALESYAGEDNRLVVDIFKLPHHGSEANLDLRLLEVVSAHHYLVSTNSVLFGHPDLRAIARVVAYGSPCELGPTRAGAHTIWFNYRTSHTLAWARGDLQKHFGYTARYPQEGTNGIGITIEVPSR